MVREREGIAEMLWKVSIMAKMYDDRCHVTTEFETSYYSECLS